MLRSASVVLLLLVGGCTPGAAGSPEKPAAASTEAPRLGACRLLTPDDVAAADQRHPDGRLRHGAHRRDLRGRQLPGRGRRGRATTTRRLGAFAYDRCSHGSKRFLGADESLVHAHRAELGVVPALGDGVGAGRPLVPLRRRRRRRAEPRRSSPCPRPRKGCCSASPTTAGWSASTGPTVDRLGEDPLLREARLAGGHHDHARRARPTPTPATGSSRCAPATTARTRWAPGSATRSTTTSATRGSTRPSGRPATAARSAGRGRTQ